MTRPQIANPFRSTLLAATLALFATEANAQASRIIIGGVASNWLGCRMTATDWAYLSPAPCAHVAGNNVGAPYVTPLSLLTTNSDFGLYTGSSGMPHVPVPDVTLFPQSPASYIEGLGNSWTVETWQLRTRGFWLNDHWNGCQSTGLTPSFSGFLAARFTFTFL
jgi:hypothetical protein